MNVNDSDDVVAKFKAAAADRPSFVSVILADASLWGADLTEIDGLVDLVAADIRQIENGGIQPLIDELA